MLLSNEETWLHDYLSLGVEKPYLFTTLNVMGGFLLLFDVTMDISYGKLISGKLPITRTTPIYRDKRVVYHGKSVPCNRTICSMWKWWLFTIDKKFPAHPVGKKMEDDFWVVPAENFWEQGIYIWKSSPVFREGIFQSDIRVPFLQSHLWYQFQAFAVVFFDKWNWFVQMVKGDFGTKFTIPRILRTIYPNRGPAGLPIWDFCLLK